MRNSLKIILALVSGLVLSCTKPEVRIDSAVQLNVSQKKLLENGGEMWVGIQAKGQWTLSLSFADSPEGPVEPWASFRVLSGENDTMVGLSYEANTTEYAREVTIILTSGLSEDRCVLTQTSPHIVKSSLPEWMELPELSDNLEFYSHSFKHGLLRYRNYSFGWLQSKKVSVWVAYPLHSFYTNGSTGRADSFGFDPDVPFNEQANLVSGSYRGRYDRGHQIPSADRRVNVEAEAQTYYATNMTPQPSDFNQGVWANLEAAFRSYMSKVDTLYVVTGCIMDGSAGGTTDSAGNYCEIPGKYYKTALGRSRKTGEWKAIAFLMDPKTCDNVVGKEDCLSVNELEEITGTNFYPRLEDLLGHAAAEAVEGENPRNSFWW